MFYSRVRQSLLISFFPGSKNLGSRGKAWDFCPFPECHQSLNIYHIFVCVPYTHTSLPFQRLSNVLHLLCGGVNIRNIQGSHPSSLIPHLSSLIPHPSPLLPNLSSFLPNPYSLLPRPSSLNSPHLPLTSPSSSLALYPSPITPSPALLLRKLDSLKFGNILERIR